jgi:hypothetical protein
MSMSGLALTQKLSFCAPVLYSRSPPLANGVILDLRISKSITSALDWQPGYVLLARKGVVRGISLRPTTR